MEPVIPNECQSASHITRCKVSQLQLWKHTKELGKHSSLAPASGLARVCYLAVNKY